MVLKWGTLHRHIAVLFTIACVNSAWSVELTGKTWDAGTANKSVMVLLYDPECIHCMELKPKWARLEYFYRNKPDAVVVTVNCAEGGGHSKQICKKPLFFPTIYHGKPHGKWGLQEYEGDSLWKDIELLASKELGIVCTPSFLDACDEVMKAKILKLQQMTKEELQAAMKATDEAVAKVKNEFDDEIEKLQQKIVELRSSKPRAMEEVAEARGDYLTRAVLSLKDPFFEVTLDNEDKELDLDDLEKFEDLSRMEKVMKDVEDDDKPKGTKDPQKGKSSEEDGDEDEDSRKMTQIPQRT